MGKTNQQAVAPHVVCYPFWLVGVEVEHETYTLNTDPVLYLKSESDADILVDRLESTDPDLEDLEDGVEDDLKSFTDSVRNTYDLPITWYTQKVYLDVDQILSHGGEIFDSWHDAARYLIDGE